VNENKRERGDEARRIMERKYHSKREREKQRALPITTRTGLND
jgi:hypothetical protein